MPQVVLAAGKGRIDGSIKAKVFSFLEKLSESDTGSGIHIEPLHNPADSRARTGRVDKKLRAVLFRLDPDDGERVYVYIGTYPHDEGTEIARTHILRVNAVNGVPELVEASAPPAVIPDGTRYESSTTSEPVLAELGYLRRDLTEDLGFDEATAERAFEATTEEQLLSLAERMPNRWQQDAMLSLAVGEPVAQIQQSLGISEAVPAEEGADQAEDERLIRSLRHPAAQMQFTFIEDNDELRRVIEDGDFGAWRVFLHPDQRRYATGSWNGAFRLTGGAGTGKTVVLIHRARALARRDPGSRIILTTFTRALSAALERDLRRLDPTINVAPAVGDPGIHVRGIDALAVAIRDVAGARGFADAAKLVLGSAVEPGAGLVANDKGWAEAIDDASPDLPQSLLNASFFTSEYLQVVLPNRITTQEDYFRVRRPGRGVALDRRKRAEVWSVVERHRANSRSEGRMLFAEVSAVAAEYLNMHPEKRPGDHVLVDEAQDLTPTHWQLLRSLVADGPDDLFIAEDTHQRIYGHHVVLSRYGIPIVGRSRRLTLNYRTTQQNLAYALGMLEGATYVDSGGEEEGNHGYRSARSGPEPQRFPCATKSEQYDRVAEVVDGWRSDSLIRPETIAILTRSNREVTSLVEELKTRGVTVTGGAVETAGDPVVLTMHKAKGMEFSRVILFDVSARSIPSMWALKNVSEDERPDAELRERSLLYVAASRARDELVVTWQGDPSAYMPTSENRDIPSLATTSER